MEPSGKPQPPENAAYETEGNAATSNPAEERAAHHRGHGQPVARRDPGNQSLGIGDAVPSSLGRGARGEEEHSRPTQSETGLGNEIEGDTMRAPAEGRVADAVDRKPGASGSQPDLASDLDRKKREQAEARNKISEERRHGKISDGGAGRGVET